MMGIEDPTGAETIATEPRAPSTSTEFKTVVKTLKPKDTADKMSPDGSETTTKEIKTGQSGTAAVLAITESVGRQTGLDTHSDQPEVLHIKEVVVSETVIAGQSGTQGDSQPTAGESVRSQAEVDAQAKAERKQKQSSEPSKIKKLDEVVVNRIAAGEIIHRPANAIKELLENSLDAGSTSINVVAKSGGLKVLQISDNGCGIKREDLGIVCERFTTSKLKKFDDLKSIATFGFRGEALASITHVAHVTITTRTATAKCAFRAIYSDGVLVGAKPGANSDPKPCAGNKGTTILVEDLFYNMTVRRKALRSITDEYSRIVEVISRYAVHNAGVAFSVKKQGEMTSDVRTNEGATRLDNIRTIYGTKVARELLPLEATITAHDIRVSGLVSNANYNSKKGTFIIFINQRLVNCAALRKGIELIYALHLPKHTHPFVYLSVELPAHCVDVNVHPTKEEVHFLHEDVVVEHIQNTLTDVLLGADRSRTYYTQTRLTGGVLDEEEMQSSQTQRKRVDETKMIRTDASSQTLKAFYKEMPSSQSSQTRTQPGVSVSLTDGLDTHPKPLNSEGNNSQGSEDEWSTDERNFSKRSLSESQSQPSVIDSVDTRVSKRARVLVRLSSVQEIRQEITSRAHSGLTDLMRQHTFLGVVNHNQALLQHRTKLFLANTTTLSKALFYQLVIKNFQNFGRMILNPPADVKTLLSLALADPESGFSEEEYGDADEMIENVLNELLTKRALLLEYFSIDLSEDGQLLALPVILRHYTPDLHRLPMFMLRLATEVEWSTEMDCFRTVANELCIFYHFRQSIRAQRMDSCAPDVARTTPADGADEADTSSAVASQSSTGETTPSEDALSGSAGKPGWRWTVEHVLFPAIKRHLQPHASYNDDGTLVVLADLPELYKVFERC